MMKAEEQLRKTIIASMDKAVWSDIQPLLNAVTCARDDGVAMDENGCDENAIRLMLALREKMREMGLAPKCHLHENEWKDLESFYKKRTNLLAESYKYVEKLKRTYKFEHNIMPVNAHYTDDGWDYGNKSYDEIEWIFPVGRGKQKHTHFYYNELDHYLTYLVGRIRGKKSADDCSRECGLKVLKSEIEDLQENGTHA